ncbi:hypothetical protein [Microseira wollei]|nr:hypothetical protein [Microseira wollei]
MIYQLRPCNPVSGRNRVFGDSDKKPGLLLRSLVPFPKDFSDKPGFFA